MVDAPLPFPTEAELFAASGYPALPVRVLYRPPRSWHPLRDGEEVARYLYTGEHGEARFQCIRFHLRPGHPSAPDKAFLWRCVDADGRWRWGVDGETTVLYRLARVRAAVQAGERVFVVEGEKDVHALEGLGFVATTNPLGALQWTAAHAEALRGADVVVVPDTDRSGMAHAARVVASLRGRARSTALLLLPVDRREDVSDWIARGNGTGELARLADAAPRDPSPAELAALLDVPPDVDPLLATPEMLRTLVEGTAQGTRAAPAPHPAFGRTAAAFARLGVELRPAIQTSPESGLSEAHPTYRAILDAIRVADSAARPLLEDASLLDCASYELGLFGRLLRAAMAGETPAQVTEADPEKVAFATASSIRLVRTRWDWETFLAEPDRSEAAASGTTWVLHLPTSGPVQVRRLHPLPALILEACAQPLTRDGAVALIAEQVGGDHAQIAAVVHAQIDQLRASGLLHPFPATPVDHVVAEMRHLLLADEVPQAVPRSLVGLLARGVRPTQEHADAASCAEDGAYAIHRLDGSVDLLEQFLRHARLRDAFSAELDGYWAGGDVHARAATLLPLLDALDRVLGSGVHRLPPFVLSP